jgi:hypothetical protein
MMSTLATQSGQPSLVATLRAGLRAALFLPPRPQGGNASWAQLLLLTVINVAIHFAWDYASVGRHGELNLSGLPSALFGLPILLLTAWSMARLARQEQLTLPLLLLFSVICLPYDLATLATQWLLDQDLLPAFPLEWDSVIDKLPVAAFALACGVAAIRLLALSLPRKIGALMLGLLFAGLPLSQAYRDQALWVSRQDQAALAESDEGREALDNEDVFYAQPRLLERELAALKPSAKRAIGMYFVGAAGYADQDVFMNEVLFVSELFKNRFATDGHSVVLINNPKTAAERPIASATSLALAFKRIAAVMDSNKDVLFLYLSSHGSPDHKFALDFGAMQFNDLDPQRLRQILDESGIRRRVIVVSACYSGAFIDALKNPDTLVITASAADKNSFGCSNEADFTYFGKAYFDDALGKTDSFIDAFALARPLIAAREKKEHFDPSDPRISVGARIRPVLDEFARQRAGARVAISGPAAPYVN